MRKNRIATTLAIVIGVIVSLAIALGAVIVSVGVLQNSNDSRYYLIAVFGVIGLIGGYLCHNLLHEVGHFLFAKRYETEVFEVAFCGLVFSKNEKVKVNLKSGVGGWTSFLPVNPKDAKKVLKASLWGGLIGSLISLLIAYALFQVGRFFNVYELVTVFGFDLAINFYLITLNFLSYNNGTDGKLMTNMNCKDNDYFNVKACEMEYQSHMMGGKSAKEIVSLTLGDINVPTVFDVEKALQSGDLKCAKLFIDKIVSQAKTDDNGLIDAYLEDLFISIVSKNDDLINSNYEKICSYILEPTTLLSYRVAIYYRRYTEEYAWAEGLEKTYLRLLEKNPLPGYKKQETEIYDLYRFW